MVKSLDKVRLVWYYCIVLNKSCERIEIRREDLMGVVAQLPEKQRKSVKDYAEFLLDKYYREVESEE
jgi:hypothetical protein